MVDERLTASLTLQQHIGILTTRSGGDLTPTKGYDAIMAHWTGGKPTCRELGASDVVLVVFAALLIPFYELIRAGNYWGRVNDWLDNPSYVEIAEIIQSGGFLGEEHHFWGLPLVIAGAQVAFGISGFAALIAISIACSVAASFLMYRLYGAVATVAFLILCPEWVRLSVMGGSEPLFLCLLLASWLAFRSDRVLMAVLLASFATTVRPVGFIALCAFAFTLILRRHWRELAMSICIGVGIGLGISRVPAGSDWRRIHQFQALFGLRLAFGKSIFTSVCATSQEFLRLCCTGVGPAGCNHYFPSCS